MDVATSPRVQPILKDPEASRAFQRAVHSGKPFKVNGDRYRIIPAPSRETERLDDQGQVIRALIYVIGTLLVGFVAYIAFLSSQI